MVSKRQLKTEASIYFFDLESWEVKALVLEALDNAMHKSRCGRLAGAGASLCDTSTYTVELLVTDRNRCEDVVAQCCASLGLDDYEMSFYEL
jgi:hypothetical protein